MKTRVRNFEENAWADYCVNHPGMYIAQACLKNVTPFQFWCLADNYPDLVSRRPCKSARHVLKTLTPFRFWCLADNSPDLVSQSHAHSDQING